MNQMQNKSQKAYASALAKIKSGKSVPLLRVIRLKCLDCCCWQENEVKLCPADECILHSFRMGRKEARKKKTLTPEQIKQRLKALRKSRTI